MMDSGYRIVRVHLHWYGLKFTVCVEIHAEYFSITIFVELESMNDLDWFGLPAKFSMLKSIVNGTDVQTNISDLSCYFYEEFWDGLLQKIFTRDSLIPYVEHRMFDNIFADFRGIILSETEIRFNDPNKPQGSQPWGHEAHRRFRTLVTILDTNQKPRYECTTSYMLDERALYMTAMGPQRPEDHDDRRIPLTYLLYIHQRNLDGGPKIRVNEWQLGRLVDHIHLLGTVCLAALKDFRELRSAGTALAELDPKARKARDFISKHDREDAPNDDVIGHIADVHEHFNKITDRFADDSASGVGLLYRVERSRYYVKQFETNIKALRLSRIEGSQQYDEFVARRLGAAFDFIDRLGRRYERAVSSLLMLDQNYLAIRANKTSADVKRIQRYGELALIGALIPYYLMAQVAHVIPAEAPTKELVVRLMTVGVSALFAGIAMYKFCEFETHKRVKKWAAGLVAVTTVLSLWVLIFFAAGDHAWMGLGRKPEPHAAPNSAPEQMRAAPEAPPP